MAEQTEPEAPTPEAVLQWMRETRSGAKRAAQHFGLSLDAVRSMQARAWWEAGSHARPEVMERLSVDHVAALDKFDAALVQAELFLLEKDIRAMGPDVYFERRARMVNVFARLARHSGPRPRRLFADVEEAYEQVMASGPKRCANAAWGR